VSADRIRVKRLPGAKDFTRRPAYTAEPPRESSTAAATLVQVGSDSFSVLSRGPEETGRIGAALATRLRPGDTVLLKGDLAAGKTTLVKAVAAALGSTDVVTSPTFALAQFYRTPGSRILHIDTYRLADLAEYRDLALEEYAAESITLVEWGEKIAGDFPCHLEVDFERAEGEERTISFTSDCDRWTAQMPDLRAELEEL